MRRAVGAAILSAIVCLERAAGATPRCPRPRESTEPCSCVGDSRSADFCPTRDWELLVKPTQDGHEGIQAAGGHGVKVEYLASIDAYLVRARSFDEMENLASQLKQFAKRIEANHGYRTQQEGGVVLPDDPDFASQWSLHNDGSLDDATEDVDINAPEAWHAVTSPKPAVVGIIDSGVDLRSKELEEAVWTNDAERNGAPEADDDGNDVRDDVRGINAITGRALPEDGLDGTGHGTWVASIVAALAENATAMAGVAPTAEFIPCRASANDCATAADAAVCLKYLTDLRAHGNAPLVAANISFEGRGCSCELEEEIRRARERGVLVVAAAGNDGSSNDEAPIYPASYPVSNVIAVAASRSWDARWDRSRGAYNYGYRSVHLSAPGSRVVALERGEYPGVTTVSGTSFAAPHVAGVLALLAAKGVEDWRVRRNLVLAGGVPVEGLTNKSITGRRLRAWDTNGLGAMTCAGQLVHRRIQPVADECAMASTQTAVEIRVVGIDCGSSSEPTVEYRQNRSSGAWSPLELVDDGTGADEIASDGEWTALWTPPARGKDYRIVVRDPADPDSTEDALVIEVP